MSDSYSRISAVFYIINSMLGTGINFMPATFNNSGTILGFGMLFCVSCLTAFSIYILFRVAIKFQGEYEHITFANLANPPYLRRMIDYSMVAASLFSAIGFQKFAKELFTLFISEFLPDKTPIFYKYLEITILLVITIIFTGLAMIKKIGNLKILSKLSVFCVTSLMIVLMVLNVFLPTSKIRNLKGTDNKMNYTFSLSWFIMSMYTQPNIPILFPHLEDKSQTNLIFISAIAAFCGFLIYGMAGFLGFNLLGQHIGTSDIMRIFLDNNSSLNNYLASNSDINSTISRILWYMTKYQGICAIIILMVGFPLRIAPATRYFKNFFSDRIKNTDGVHNIIVIIEMFIITMVNLIPNISLNLIYGLLGPSAVGFLSFLFPSLLYFLYRDKKSAVKNIFSWIIMLASVVYCFYGCYTAFKNFCSVEINYEAPIAKETLVTNQN